MQKFCFSENLKTNVFWFCFRSPCALLGFSPQIYKLPLAILPLLSDPSLLKVYFTKQYVVYHIKKLVTSRVKSARVERINRVYVSSWHLLALKSTIVKVSGEISQIDCQLYKCYSIIQVSLVRADHHQKETPCRTGSLIVAFDRRFIKTKGRHRKIDNAPRLANMALGQRRIISLSMQPFISRTRSRAAINLIASKLIVLSELAFRESGRRRLSKKILKNKPKID